MSPMLFLLANLTLICALLAEERMKVTFFKTFAREARRRKAPGNFKVKTSMWIESA